VIVLLWLLASLDAAFSGYRAAASRSGLIRKGRYYRDAVARGVLYGQAVVLVCAAAGGVLLALAPDRAGLVRDLSEVARRLVLFYLPYTAAIAAGFVVRALPSVDLRSLASTLVFGPLTLLRPFVVVAGLVYGVWAAPRLPVALLATLAGGMLLALETVLGGAYRDA
jgi:hypothetical protein